LIGRRFIGVSVFCGLNEAQARIEPDQISSLPDSTTYVSVWMLGAKGSIEDADRICAWTNV
jgi:hypothetical protein